MASPYADYKKDGMDRLLKLGRALCALVLTFAPVIRGKYGANVAIIALLTAVENLCPLIGDAEAEFLALGSDDPPIPSDPSTLTGINASAPESGEPTDII